MVPARRDHAASEVPIDEFTTDFGGLRHARPRVVHRMPRAFPSALLATGSPLALRGTGHSCDGHTVTDGELLVTHTPGAAAAQLCDLGGGLLEVPGGATWFEVQRYASRLGSALPVLPDYLHMSVGGTLSVGGVGVDSVRCGMQIDHVERIQLIDGTGVSRWCSRTDHPELFRFALAGLGTAGLIERAVLRTVPARHAAHLHRTQHATLAELADHTERVAQRDDVDLYTANLRRGRIVSTTGWYDRSPRECADERCSVLTDLPYQGQASTARAADLPPGRVRLWADYVVPAGRLAPMLAAVETLRHRIPAERFYTMVYVLIVRRPADATVFPFAAVAPGPVSIGVGVYTWAKRAGDDVTVVRDLLDRLLDHCCDLGGRPYLYCRNDLDDALAARLYGSDLDRLAELRREYRLDHVNAQISLAGAAARRTPPARPA
ncbi:FAD-binding protein [Nocardia blacklockiae]|uniref:FAD-binding protein n=1 Tax=Nocardia blacklockiae TaxID=480036 RepID=UPI0018935974|nr:FAD-binding protein [Nocardia blacklockiae]MBF6175651.1 FAD-binding protein [Nocardia blacklockiae]